MSNDRPNLTEQLVAMRGAFDESFAAPLQLEEEALERLLLIRVAGEAFAIRNVQIARLARMEKLLRVPSRLPELMGIAGIRSTLVAVFDLASLLGLDSGAASGWLALTPGETPVALAFQHVDGHVSIPRTSLYPSHESSVTGPYVMEAVRIGQVVRGLINVPTIVESIQRRAGVVNSNGE